MSQLIGIVLFVVYFGGIWKFLKGYKKTNFSTQLPYKIALSALWPIFLLANKSYRKNFQKALKG
jgi:hypothetical protein